MTHINAVRLVRQATMHLEASPERVFPLLCPVREYDWLPTWEARIVFTASGFAEPGCVFTTTDEHGRESVWTVSRYQAGLTIEFVVVVTGLYVTKLDIALRRDGESTSIDWRRTFTALTPEGERAMAEITEEGFAAHAARLEAQLAHYLETGAALHL
jgi:hypothetical protein